MLADFSACVVVLGWGTCITLPYHSHNLRKLLRVILIVWIFIIICVLIHSKRLQYSSPKLKQNCTTSNCEWLHLEGLSQFRLLLTSWLSILAWHLFRHFKRHRIAHFDRAILEWKFVSLLICARKTTLKIEPFFFFFKPFNVFGKGLKRGRAHFCWKTAIQILVFLTGCMTLPSELTKFKVTPVEKRVHWMQRSKSIYSQNCSETSTCNLKKKKKNWQCYYATD